MSKSQKFLDVPDSVHGWFLRGGAAVVGTLLLAAAVSRIVYPFDTGNLEAFNWVPANHVLGGSNPYSFAATPPYSMAPYGIVYYLLIALGVAMFGLQVWFGRVLSVLAFAACVWAVVAISRTLTKSTHASWACGLIALSMFPGQMWIGIMRSDLIGLAFALVAFCLVLTAGDDDRFSVFRTTMVVLLTVAAILTKHTLMLSAAMIALRLLQTQRWRSFVIFSVGVALSVVAIGLLLDYTSSGGYFWQHFTHARTLPFDFNELVALVLQVLIEPTSIVLAIAIAVYVVLSFRSNSATRRRTSPVILIFLYLVLSSIASTIASGRIGANVNYFLETSFVAAIAGGVVYEGLSRNSWRRGALCVVVLITLGSILQLARVGRGEYFRWKALPYYREVYASAAERVTPDSLCISVYAELVMQYGCRLHFDDFGEYVGPWSPELRSIFDGEVRSGKYAVIIWNANDIEEKYPNYKLVPMSQPAPNRFFPVYLYVPREGSQEK